MSIAEIQSGVDMLPNAARLVAFYLSRDRTLGLLHPQHLPAHIIAALQGHNVQMSAAILSNVVGSYLLHAIAVGGVKTLLQLAFEGELKQGTPFIYNGHFSGKGFGATSKSPALSLTAKLDAPLAGKKLLFEFSKNGLVNTTAYTRMSGSTRLFAFGYISGIDDTTIRAVPYVVGDLVADNHAMASPFLSTLELRPEEIKQFGGMDETWFPSKAEFQRMTMVSELAVKELICRLLGEHSVPSDWGGEECDVLSANVVVDGQRHTGAFLLKGPARFHPMKPADLGKNGDQLYRLFNIPAQIYFVQHCHNIGPAVRKQAEAFALARSFIAPCKIVFMDGLTTARLLRAHGLWPEAPMTSIKGKMV
ncbi:methyltransferase [Pseudomonas guariconensis]|uniref:methyltransferase n=2 Tax=Pseudomonas TaxID=286 RepID=UPI00209804DA|nr:MULTISPECIES: methyltransferase [Pseudomonas]MCO7515012.1 methyltransferase [Pseudomonas putida]MCO7604239.1 methyltransferase [Pseudomonas guariconensis]